jgi:hypothetical protein
MDLGNYCKDNKIGFDLFLFDLYKFELATVAPIIGLSGGHLYYYGGFSSYKFHLLQPF